MRSVTLGFVLAVIIGLTIFAPGSTSSQDLDAVSVTVGTSDPFTYRIVDLGGLPRSKIITHTPWTDGPKIFEGALLRDIIGPIEHNSGFSKIVVAAHNDYTTEIPLEDLRSYDVLLAWKMGDIRLTLADKGPFWIIYPLDQVGDAQADHLHKMVWQVRSLQIE